MKTNNKISLFKT